MKCEHCNFEIQGNTPLGIIKCWDTMYEHVKNEHGIDLPYLGEMVRRNRIAYGYAMDMA